jgi:hypothetical protein
MKTEERKSMGEEKLDTATDEACTWLKFGTEHRGGII